MGLHTENRALLGSVGPLEGDGEGKLNVRARLKDALGEPDLDDLAGSSPLGGRRCWAEVCFTSAHLIALFVAVYGTLWTAVGTFAYPKSTAPPDHLVWLPLQLFKLGYPMVPVILWCWHLRFCCRDTLHRMTAGYYFANLKMALLPSLGPGLLIGGVVKFALVHAFHLQEELGDVCMACLLPVAWLLGCFLWYLLSCICRIDLGQEARREDWGLYARWVVVAKPAIPWQKWIRRGPHNLLGIIAFPRHGTFHKVTSASTGRLLGITICTFAAYLSLLAVAWWQRGRLVAAVEWPHAFAIMATTDYCNLIANCITAPFLVRWTWRNEPYPSEGSCSSFANEIQSSERSERLLASGLVVERDVWGRPLEVQASKADEYSDALDQ